MVGQGPGCREVWGGGGGLRMQHWIDLEGSGVLWWGTEVLVLYRVTGVGFVRLKGKHLAPVVFWKRSASGDSA